MVLPSFYSRTPESVCFAESYTFGSSGNSTPLVTRRSANRKLRSRNRSANREELSRLLQELGTQALVVEVEDERVDDRTRDRRDEHRRANAGTRIGTGTH